MNDIVVELLAQLLYQVSPSYSAPSWLIDAVERGDLPITRCPEADEDEEGEEAAEGEAGRVVHFRGCA